MSVCAGFVSKVRLSTVGCVALGGAVLFILRSRLLLYSARSGVNRVQVVLPGLFCPSKNFMYVCLYAFLG